VLAAMPACKIVARVGTGLDSIDLDAAAQRVVLARAQTATMEH
jgi:phosphoglycerate dehydrogenase-like enzyme